MPSIFSGGFGSSFFTDPGGALGLNPTHKDLFGGNIDPGSAAGLAAQQEANKKAFDFIESQQTVARSAALPLFADAQRVAQQGTQGALDVISGGIPAQIAAQNQGNFLAQQQTANAQQQVQNAILGLPTQQFQPQQAAPIDLSFLQNPIAPQAQQPNLPTSVQVVPPPPPTRKARKLFG